MTLKILFFGSSNYCLPVLESIYKNFNLVAIVTRSNRPVGRKQLLTPSEPKKFAKSHNIKVYTPKDKIELLSLKDTLSQLQPDLAIVSDYGLIIPKEIFNLPKQKTLNIHFSKLPKFRGPSPVQYTILYGAKSAWISIIIMDEGMDTGDILWQKEVALAGTETTEILYKKLFNITAKELPDIIKKYTNNQLKPIKQDHSKATYTKLFTKKDGFIPPKLLSSVILLPRLNRGRRISRESLKSVGILQRQLALQDDNWVNLIERVLRAFTPWPGVWTEITLKHLGGDKLSLRSYDSPEVEGAEKCRTKRLKILKAHLEPTTKLVLDLVQLEGKKPVSFRQFKEGYPNFSLSD